ncbi:MAG TPA: Stp1/IreP family PP2C-type Ser/Thr phosphatase [Solirubrobacteraceae bacterium]|nr:Stp1/IreP family PP2C-type Ser/Thr phosphatase [Solirubrobacteraceae bacterium]
MLRVADHYAGTDTGRQRRANEDSLLARSPLFVVADGMGGAQAGEVASQIAVDYFREQLEDDTPPESALATRALAANSRIHELSHSNAEHAGMGTTLTAVYVGGEEVAIAHVGDSRAYCLRDGELLRLTDDHSLVDELMRQGRLTPEEAVEHPQRSVITRALGPEGTVEVDTRSFRARSGDVYLLCSDGLTTMLSEEQIASVLLAYPRLRDAGEALIAAANEAGGQDNITVVLLRLEEVGAGSPPASDGAPPDEHATMLGVPAVAPALSPRQPRRPEAAPGRSAAARRRRRRRAASALLALLLLALIASGAYLAQQSVYFIGTNSRGLVTLYQGVPFVLPGNLALYRSRYVSGVSASTLTQQRRQTLLDHSLRSESSAAGLLRSLELGQLE